MPRRIIRNAIQISHLDALPPGLPGLAPVKPKRATSKPAAAKAAKATKPRRVKQPLTPEAAAKKAREKAANDVRCRALREKLDAQIQAEGFPAARKEYEFARARIGRKWQLDLSWEPERIVVEIEGRGRHQIWSGYVKDIEKYNTLAVWGWLLVRVTYDMIEDDSAIAIIRAAFAYRRAEAA